MIRGPGGSTWCRASIRRPGSWSSCCALAALLFARGPVPWSGLLRCPWSCCRLSSVCSCRWPSPVRIAAGVVVPFGVAVPVALVMLVAGKEQGGRFGCEFFLTGLE